MNTSLKNDRAPSNFFNEGITKNTITQSYRHDTLLRREESMAPGFNKKDDELIFYEEKNNISSALIDEEE